ncbi:unnamed protein product [Ectocarpus sp. 8 AP-2014]
MRCSLTPQVHDGRRKSSADLLVSLKTTGIILLFVDSPITGEFSRERSALARYERGQERTGELRDVSLCTCTELFLFPVVSSQGQQRVALHLYSVEEYESPPPSMEASCSRRAALLLFSVLERYVCLSVFFPGVSRSCLCDAAAQQRCGCTGKCLCCSSGGPSTTPVSARRID